MNKSTIFLIILLSISLYKAYKTFYSRKIVTPPALIEQNPRNKHQDLKKTVNPHLNIMPDKRINPIAGENSIVKQEPKRDPDPIRDRFPSNTERILQYELNVWSRGLSEDEVSNLKYLWGKYTSNQKFGQNEKEMLDKLDKRNILNAIRLSRPSLIKEHNDIIKEDKLHKNQLEEDSYQKDYQEQNDEDSYEKEYQNNNSDNYYEKNQDDIY